MAILLDLIMLGALTLISFIVIAATQFRIEKKPKKKNTYEKK